MLFSCFINTLNLAKSFNKNNDLSCVFSGICINFLETKYTNDVGIYSNYFNFFFKNQPNTSFYYDLNFKDLYPFFRFFFISDYNSEYFDYKVLAYLVDFYSTGNYLEEERNCNSLIGKFNYFLKNIYINSDYCSKHKTKNNVNYKHNYQNNEFSVLYTLKCFKSHLDSFNPTHYYNYKTKDLNPLNKNPNTTNYSNVVPNWAVNTEYFGYSSFYKKKYKNFYKYKLYGGEI